MPRKKKAAPAPVAPYNTGDPQPVRAATGQAYGANQAQRRSQAAVPLSGGVRTVPLPPPPQGGAMPPPDVNPPPANAGDLLAAATNYQPPDARLTAPTNNPGEPVTAGLATGPGPGPGALMGMPDPTQADVRLWKPYLPTLEYLASQPDSSASTRNFVRRLRAVMPPSAAL